MSEAPASDAPDGIVVGSRTVAIFDVLGVKEDILAGRSADLISRYRARVSQIDQLRDFEYPGTNIPRLFPLGSRARLRPSLHIFSDTLILIAPDESLEATSAVLIESWRLMQAFMTGRMPIRGGISHGEMHIDSTDRLHVGRALTDAHLLEASQAWAGCIVDQSVLDRFPPDPWAEQGFAGIFELIFPRFDVPMKGDGEVVAESRRCVNWRCNLVFDRGFATDFIEAFGTKSVGHLHPYIQRALMFGKEHRIYPQPTETVPVECRVYWVGKSEPPFNNGDEY